MLTLDEQPEPFAPKAKKKKPVRETGRYGTEAAGKKRVAAAGGESLKWVSPGFNGVPDQIELYGVEPMMVAAAMLGYQLTIQQAEALLRAAIRFTEYKAPKKVPTPNQLRVHERLRARGFTVSVVDTKEAS